jgi:hypothetical protein
MKLTEVFALQEVEEVVEAMQNLDAFLVEFNVTMRATTAGLAALIEVAFFEGLGQMEGQLLSGIEASPDAQRSCGEELRAIDELLEEYGR